MTEKPRVFHLITRLLKGGAEAKTIETVTGLDQYEFVVGFGSSFDSDQVEYLNDNNIYSKQFKTIQHYNPVTSVPAVLSVARYIQKEDFDCVHTHSTEAGIIGRFAAALTGTPVIHTVHGVPFADDRNTVLESFILTCEKLAAKQTDCIVTNADAIKQDYLSRGIGFNDQYTTVYSGIQIEQFDKASPASDLDASKISILMVGRLANGKGFEDLLDALQLIDTERISVYFVGEGPMKTRLTSLIGQYDLHQTVQMLGYRDDIPELMAGADMLVLPSYREGTPRVITEAMASGLPVISTNIAGIPEQIQHGTNGYLISPGDVESLAVYIEKLVDSQSLRKEFGQAGRERVRKFSVEQMLTDIDSVYQTVIQNRS